MDIRVDPATAAELRLRLTGAGLAVEVAEGVHVDVSDFARRTRGARMPALVVEVRRGAAHVGPIAEPGRAGCAECARRRRVAAAAAGAPAVHTAPDVDGAVVDAVVALVCGRDERLRDHVARVTAEGVTWHRVVPLPDCHVCAGDRHEPADPPTWVDPLTGIVAAVEASRPLDRGPHIATTAAPHRVEEDGRARALPEGWGVGMTRAAAVEAAVAEAVGKYAASTPDPERLVWARPADLDGDVLDPREFPLYAPEQYRPGFGFAPFDRRLDHPWVRGTWLGTTAPVWVPAVLAYLSPPVLPEHRICQSTPHGLAADPDPVAAATRAVLDLVGRDAVLAAWLTGDRGRFVALDDTLDPDSREVVEALTGAGHGVEVHLLPSTYGAAAAALALGDGGRLPGVVLGLGADRGPRAAIAAALLDLAHALARSRTRPAPRRPEDVRDRLDHAAFHARADRLSAFDRLRCGGTSRLADLPTTGAPASTADLAGVLGAAGARVALVDVTSADARPLRVLRAVSPDLQPVGHGHGNERLPVARLRARLLPPHRRSVHPVW